MRPCIIHRLSYVQLLAGGLTYRTLELKFLHGDVEDHTLERIKNSLCQPAMNFTCESPSSDGVNTEEAICSNVQAITVDACVSFVL